MYVTSIGPEIEDRITNDLAGAVIGDISAATSLVDCNPEGGKPLVRRDDIATRDLAANTERDDRRVLEEEKKIGNAVCPALFDELALQRKCLVVRHHAETTDFELTHPFSDGRGHDVPRRPPSAYMRSASKFSICCLTSAMN